MMKTLFSALVIVSLMAAAAPSALAHGSMKPRHGGQVTMVGETLFELALTPAGAALYVLEEDEPVVSAQMSAKLSITVAGQKRDVMMKSAGANKFMAPGVKIPKGAKVGVLVIDNASKARSSAVFAIS